MKLEIEFLEYQNVSEHDEQEIIQVTFRISRTAADTIIPLISKAVNDGSTTQIEVEDE